MIYKKIDELDYIFTCTGVTCPPPPGITDGIYQITDGTGSDFASRVVYSCNTGFQLDGAAVLFCLPNGTWSAAGPSCISMYKTSYEQSRN